MNAFNEKTGEIERGMQVCLRALHQTCKKNADRKDILFSLDREWAFERFRCQLGRCRISGIKFSSEDYRQTGRRPLIPSVDRIDSRGNYTEANCRLIVYALNAAKNEWDDDLLLTVANGLVWFHENNPKAHGLILDQVHPPRSRRVSVHQQCVYLG
jgi:hypothetical protein